MQGSISIVGEKLLEAIVPGNRCSLNNGFANFLSLLKVKIKFLIRIILKDSITFDPTRMMLGFFGTQEIQDQ